MPLPIDFWAKEKARLIAELLPRIQALAMTGAAIQAGELNRLGIFFDPVAYNRGAAEWARLHTDDILNQFGTTNLRVVGPILDNWIATPGATVGDLTDQIAQALGVNSGRANSIAVTEATNALAAGEALALEASGSPRVVFRPTAHPRCRCDISPRQLKNGDWVVVWLTNRDDVVCKSKIKVPWSQDPVAGCKALHTIIISEGPYLGMTFADANK